MKMICGEDALKILSRNGPECMIASDTLGYLLKNNANFDCYWDDPCIIFIDRSTETDHITVVPLAQTFDSKALRDIIRQGNPNFDVWIDIQKLSASFFTSLDLEMRGFLNYERTLEDFIYSGQTPMDCVSETVRLLDLEDRDVFDSLSSESIANRPPLRVLFDVFVANKQGFILGAFDGAQLVGYLSFFQMLPGVFDVDYIYVSPSKRGAGFGTALGNAYAGYAHERNQIAYWSNAQNDASRLTALSCGFQLVRQANKYTGGIRGEYDGRG